MQTHLTFGREFTEAVEMKQVAQQEAERARFVVEKVKSLPQLAHYSDVQICSRMVGYFSEGSPVPAVHGGLFFSFSICSIDNTSYYSCHQIYCWLPVMPMIKGKKVVCMIYLILSTAFAHNACRLSHQELIEMIIMYALSMSAVRQLALQPHIHLPHCFPASWSQYLDLFFSLWRLTLSLGCCIQAETKIGLFGLSACPYASI